MDSSFTLGGLLSLELHNCVDAVTEIVDRAQKEALVRSSARAAAASNCTLLSSPATATVEDGATSAAISQLLCRWKKRCTRLRRRGRPWT